MDDKSMPGINCESIILAESFFRRNPVIPEDLKFNINFNLNNSINNTDRLITELTATVNQESDSVYIKVKYIGIFSTGDDPKIKLNDFSLNFAAAYLFPYIRETIHSLTIKGSLPKHLIIPPINVLALFKQKESSNSNLGEREMERDYLAE